MRIGGILAGGQSRRMGRPKAGITLPSGLTFAEQTYRVLSPHVDDIVLLGHGIGAPKGIKRLADVADCAGPLAGLLALLRSGKADEYIVLPCDMPHLTDELLARLVACAASFTPSNPVHGDRAIPGDEDDGCAKLSCIGFRPQIPAEPPYPFPVWIHQDAIGTVEQFVASGQRRWMTLLTTLPARWCEVSAEESTLFRNLNHPEDLVK